MGTTKSAPEKSSVEALCQQIMLNKAESQSGLSMTKLIHQSLTRVLRDMNNPEKRKNTIQELSGVKGIPALIACLNTKIPGEEQGNIIQSESIKIFYELMMDDKGKFDMLFSHDIIHVVNHLALSNTKEFISTPIRIMVKCTEDKSYSEKLEAVNPLYTFNAVLAATIVDTQTKIEVLIGIKNLATKFKKEFLTRGIVATLSGIMLSEKLPTENMVRLVLSCIAIIIDEKNICTRFIEEDVIDKIRLFLTSKSPDILCSATQCFQIMCNFENGREEITKADLICLREISTSKDEVSSISAKAALLILCLNEEKLAYFKKHGWLNDIFSGFKDMKNNSGKFQIVNTLKQLSKDCLKYTLYDLYHSLIDPLLILVQDSSVVVQNRALSILLKLVIRGDVQTELGKTNSSKILLQIYPRLRSIKEKSACILILALISNNYLPLLQDINYAEFFIGKANQSREEIARECGISKPSTSQLEIIEEIVKISMVTCIALPEQYVQTDMKAKIKFVCTQCRSPSHYIRNRSAGTLSVLASIGSIRHLLVGNGVIDELMMLLKDKNDSVICQTAKAIINLSTRPENIELWLKFDSTYAVDAANLHVPELTIEIAPLKKNTGLYVIWGKEFSTGDAISFRDIPFVPAWSISVWFRTPLSKSKRKVSILVQGQTGAGAMVAYHKGAIKSFDQKTGYFITLWDGIDSLEKGWHHMAVLRSDNGKMEVLIDGKNQPENIKIVNIMEPMKYFGNSKAGNEPFGCIADLRIYTKTLAYSETKALAKYNENVIDGLPDNMIEYVNICDGVSHVIQAMANATDIVKVELCHALANLSTKSSCRSSILRNNGLPILIDCMNTKNEFLRVQAARCLVNLA
ncbi:unnamed protein product [Blepharisma stoltei]|uniref:Uncharacterized protein n=1 Tax=Blepharisma stoltei TaxID=1481888 RepID=A0AAU9IR32_9CILI|nr:unnamed protein product [Blepharisma stoltei]